MKSLKLFLEKILKKPLTRELIMYLIFGVATTVFSFAVYALFLYVVGSGVALANTFSHFFGILFAYVTNKIWVFRALDYSLKNVAKEFPKFLFGRLATYAIETVLLVILVDILFYDPMISKMFTSVIVVILNYLASKKIVFK